MTNIQPLAFKNATHVALHGKMQMPSDRAFAPTALIKYALREKRTVGEERHQAPQARGREAQALSVAGAATGPEPGHCLEAEVELS